MTSCCGANLAPVTDQHRMKVRYFGGRPIEVTGPVTGTAYRFSGTDPVQFVEPRDAIGLTRNRAFRVEGLVRINDEGHVRLEAREGDDNG